MASGDSLLMFTALNNSPPATNPATFFVRNGTPVLEFDPTTQQIAIFLAALPRIYSGGGITAYIHWAAKTNTTGTIGWDVAFERIGDGDQDLDSDDFATAQTVTAATVPASPGLVDITNVSIAHGVNMGSVAVGESFRLRVRRDVANDTATGYAHLLLVELKET